MPVARRATPPTSQIREQLGVLNSLSAWTDTGEEEKPKGSKAAYRELQNDGEVYTETWKEKVEAWLDVDGDHFNMIIGLVIISNAIVIGLETELEPGGFIVLEHLFNVIFLVEMVLRLRAMGASYFKDPWNCFDFTLVITGSLDLWLMPFVSDDGSTANIHHFQAMRMLRMLRLMRVLRVIRLFRMFQQLFLIMQAFGKAFQIVLLMGLLVLILDYVCAIMLTQGIGHQSHWWHGEDRDKVEQWFGTIPGSMQTLFLVMTLTNWDEVSNTLVQELPAPVVYSCLVLYIMVTSYTMLSLTTGIISESLITAQQEYRIRKEKLFEEKKKEISFDLRNFLLTEYMEDEDKDEYGNTKGETLKGAMRGDTELLMKLASINIHITEQGVLALIDKLSQDGIVNIDYFVDKLTNLVGAASASSIMDIKYEMAKLSAKIEMIATASARGGGGEGGGGAALGNSPKSIGGSGAGKAAAASSTQPPRLEATMSGRSHNKESKPRFAD